MQWVVALEAHAGAFHALDQQFIHFLAADPVNQHLDGNAGLRPFDQGIGEFAADVTGPADVCFEVDAVAGASDRLQHGGKYFGAVNDSCGDGEQRAKHGSGQDSFCHQVLIALYENGTPFEPHLVNLGDEEEKAAFTALWPTAA